MQWKSESVERLSYGQPKSWFRATIAPVNQILPRINRPGPPSQPAGFNYWISLITTFSVAHPGRHGDKNLGCSGQRREWAKTGRCRFPVQCFEDLRDAPKWIIQGVPKALIISRQASDWGILDRVRLRRNNI
jgi:hypothetical protein